VLYQVFHDGGAADNSFKKSTFEKAAVQVRKVYTGTHEITWTKCKNQWADLKAKWAYWTFLSKQSGAGFNENTELYEFYDYVWESLNRSHPKIIWHKTHIMPFREMISYILSDVQANGDGAFSLAEATPVDPRLLHDSTRSSRSPTPAKSSSSRGPYNKSKKRVKVEDDMEDRDTPPQKKVDLGAAIAGFSEEMKRARSAKDDFLTTQQKAVQLLEKEYKGRLDIMAFLDAIAWLQNEQNASSFITLTDPHYTVTCDR